MDRIRIPAVTGLNVEAFLSSTTTQLGSFIHNGMADKYSPSSGNDRYYVTQRPAFNISQDASDDVADTKGRGVYYWSSTSKLYVVNDDTIYDNGYASPLATTISSGTQPVTFLELGSYLILLDAENNEGWVIDTAGNVLQMTDSGTWSDSSGAPTYNFAGFPTDLASGGATLDGYLFVTNDLGQVWNSGIDDPLNWSALDFIEAERESDAGIYLTKHHDNIVVLGGRTIEFFYNAGNPVGSPLNKRKDVTYNTGCACSCSVWQEGDQVLFLGMDTRGTFGVYILKNFSIERISTGTLDSLLSNSALRNEVKTLGSGMSAKGHLFYLLTTYSLDGSINPIQTFVYDITAGLWGTWDSDLPIWDFNGFPLVAWSIRTGTSPRYGEGLLANGDVITVNDTLVPEDTDVGVIYIEIPSGDPGYVTAGYYEDIAGGDSANVKMIVRLGHLDNDNGNLKYIRDWRYIGDRAQNSQTLTVRWSDDDHDTFENSRTLDISTTYKLAGMGSYRRRTHELEYSGGETIRIEAVEMGVDQGYY